MQGIEKKRKLRMIKKCFILKKITIKINIHYLFLFFLFKNSNIMQWFV
jgi:hypothetical protein